MFQTASVPPILCRSGGLDELGRIAGELAPPGEALVVLDPWLAQGSLRVRVEDLLGSVGLRARVFDALAGEPGAGDIRAATAMARGTALVVGIGGGSALDVAKIAAACAPSPPGTDPADFALAARPLPAMSVPKILIPTTAGTGAESSSTAVFSGDSGAKLWIWGPQTKAERIVLDPVLTLSLPRALTAACAMDAFVHAFEAATNRRTHAGAQLYAHAALRLIADALPVAVAEPGDIAARTDLLLGACYGGIAIDMCGTAVAHMISHALAGLVPVGHALATALAFEATLPWLVARPTGAMEGAARAVGCTTALALPEFVAELLDAARMQRRLPDAVASVGAPALAAAMRASENVPMRAATVRDVTDADTEAFAAAMVALAAPVSVA